jgi:hypothetical protein
MQTGKDLQIEPLRRAAGKPGYKLTPQQPAGAEQDDIIHATRKHVNGWDKNYNCGLIPTIVP